MSGSLARSLGSSSPLGLPHLGRPFQIIFRPSCKVIETAGDLPLVFIPLQLGISELCNETELLTGMFAQGLDPK